MKILFIQEDVFKSYGTMLLSSILKSHGHEFDILVDSLEKDIISKIKTINPDIISFSVQSTKYAWLKNIATKIKENFKMPIAVGGPLPTFFPEVIKEDFVDIICIGEGEYALLELLDKLKRKANIAKIKNLWVKKGNKIYKNPLRNLIEDLDSLPFADTGIYLKYNYFRKQNSESVMTSRGCPYNCTFCFNKKYNEMYKDKGKIVRRRSVSNIIEEIKLILNKNKQITSLVFLDDTFILGSKAWFDEFTEKYKKEVDLPFSITARANLVNDDLIKKMKHAGCNSIRMGVESADPILRETILKKGITNEQILYASKIIKKYKIKLQLYNILGIPGETLKKALDTYKFTMKINPTHAWCSLMQFFPGTEIRDIAIKKGLIRKSESQKKEKDVFFSAFPFFQETTINIKDKNKIMNLQKLFQFGNLLRIPTPMMKQLIRLPPNKLYNLIFKINYGYSIMKMDNLSISYILKSAYHTLLRKK